MIPRTFPSIVEAFQTKMVVYVLPNTTGLKAWIDYIPVKGVTTESATLENTYANGGYQAVDSLASLTGKQAWLDYIPVYEDASYTKPWSTDAGGYIPTSALAALLLDFTSGRLDPRITFSRTTNATLTNSAGLVANAPMNLLTFSEQFDNGAWNKAAVTVTANASVAPNGTTTADLITATAGSGYVFPASSIFASAGGNTYTYSVHAKAGTSSVVQLLAAAASNYTATFNLATQVVSGVSANAQASMVSVGDGWFRLILTCNSVANNAYTEFQNGRIANGTNVYLWGAQLELGSTATTYNPTTVKNLLGFTENFDNAAWTKSNAFVQTNWILWSQSFDNAAWIKTGGNIILNATVAPNGTTTASRLLWVALTPQIQQNVAIISGTRVTLSVYAKADTKSEVTLIFFTDGSNFSQCAFNLAAGTAGSPVTNGTAYSAASPTITSVGDGWYRCTLTASTSGIFATDVWIRASTSASSGDAIYLWGAQLVQGASAGDYKATYAAAAAVGYTDIYGQPFAQKLVENTANAVHIVNVTNIGSVSALETLSFYAKAAERTWCAIQMGSSALAYYDIQNGTIGTQLNGTATITLVGNGWFKCSLTAVRAANGNNNIYTATGNNAVTYTGDGTSGIYIFGAQLSDSASVDPYVYQPVAAPSSVAYYGPRFDYDPVTLAPKGLLIEEQRTNLLTYSEDFTNAAWTATEATVTANADTSPDGTVDADKLVENTATSAHYTLRNITWTAATYTISVYAKAAGRSFAVIGENSTGGARRTWFNLSTGTVGTTSAGHTASIANAGNGWYRCSISFTATAITQWMTFYPANEDGVYIYTGNGTSGLFIWGAQLE